MFCKNCGSKLDNAATVCTNCGTGVEGSTSGFENYQDSEANYQQQAGNKPIKTTGLLVWSIIEMVSCYGFLPGLIALILWLVKLKPAADRGDAIAAKKAKLPIKISLWIGTVILIFMVIGFVIAMVIAVVLPMTNNASNIGNKSHESIDELNNFIYSIEANDTYSRYNDYDFDY